MLDHVFTDAISALRDAFEAAFLERQAFEEHFQSDVLLGDLTWETSYGLPGEGEPPRVVAHITFDWPAWSQAAYRQWYVEAELERDLRRNLRAMIWGGSGDGPEPEMKPKHKDSLFLEPTSHRIRMGGMPQPGAVLKHAHPGRGQESHLGAQLSRLLTAVVELARQVSVEEDHRIPAVGAVFCSTETEDVHP